eukprot:6490704-Amphidinium_carterae.3
MEAAEEQDIILPLNEQNIAYLAPIEGDPQDDQVRLQQMRDDGDVDDDMQSIIDANIEAERRRDEREDPEGTFWRRQQLETVQTWMDDEGRYAVGRERQQRRQEQGPARHDGSEAALHERHQALPQMVITGRRARLEAARREATQAAGVQAQEAQPTEGQPKAPPAAVQQQMQQRTKQIIDSLTLPKLRDKVQREEERR